MFKHKESQNQLCMFVGKSIYKGVLKSSKIHVFFIIVCMEVYKLNILFTTGFGDKKMQPFQENKILNCNRMQKS